MDRTKAERSLDDQNALIGKLQEADGLLIKQGRSVTASAGMLRRLITAEQKRRDLIRRDINRQRAAGR